MAGAVPPQFSVVCRQAGGSAGHGVATRKHSWSQLELVAGSPKFYIGLLGEIWLAERYAAAGGAGGAYLLPVAALDSRVRHLQYQKREWLQLREGWDKIR